MSKKQFKNKTNQTQQIHFTNGECETVLPFEKVDVDVSNIYASELRRAEKFFVITPTEDEQQEEKPKNQRGLTRKLRSADDTAKLETEKTNDGGTI